MREFSVALIVCFLWSWQLLTQTSPLDKKVTFDYRSIPLEDALVDIGGRFEINFSYSPDFIPVRQLVTAKVTNRKLSKGLDKLLSETQIVYKLIGNQVALRVDKNKVIGKIQDKMDKEVLTKVPLEKAIDRDTTSSELTQIPITIPPIDTTQTKSAPVLVEEWPDIKDITDEETDETLMDLESFKKKLRLKNNLGTNRRHAQISLVSGIGTNTYESAIITNNVSLNLLWGDNGGVNGFEAGILVNKVQKDVTGFQIAGLGNNVGNNMTGTQVGGFYNYNEGKTKGVQMAGLFNYSDAADAGQFAGLANVVENDFRGFQASIVFNKAGYDSKGVQASGLINVTQGVAKFQVGALVNKANSVSGGQIGGFMNIANEVKGFQLAFINVSDTVSGVPIGLINIVKRGYNRFEISAGEIFYINLQAKLGADQFYNIFHIGTRIPEVGNYVWGLGYGIGTRLKKTPQRFINIEAMAMQINENEPWTNQLNMVGRVRWLWGYKLKKFRTEFFWGPTLNFMVSQLRNPENDTVGSNIIPFAFFDITNGKKTTNYKGWIGLNGGIRF